VTLPDPEIETSAVFDLFLDLIVNLPLEGLLDSVKTLTFPDWLCVCGLFKFLHKWECAQPFRKVLRHNITQELRNPDTALEYYAIGAIVNDPDICRAVLQNNAENKLAAFNPYHFQYFMWKACPPPYIGALTRVWAEAQVDERYNFISRFNLHLTDFTFSEAQLTCVERERGAYQCQSSHVELEPRLPHRRQLVAEPAVGNGGPWRHTRNDLNEVHTPCHRMQYRSGRFAAIAACAPWAW
jgi:hypothetical protein